MIIEFYGLPASGKTTDMDAILQKYKNAVNLADYSQKITKLKKLSLVLTPEFLSFFIKTIMLFFKKKNKVSYDLKVLYAFCYIYVKYMYFRKDKTYDYYLIDHGIVQNIVSALWDDSSLVSNGKKIVEHMGKYFQNDIAFIYTLNGDNENIYSRITTRRFDIRLKHYSYEDAEKVLKSQAVIFENLNEEVQKYFSVLKVDSLDSFESCFDKICTYLEEQK